MDILIILVPVSFILSILALLTFLWTLKNSQYDDLEGDAWRILLEDDGSGEALEMDKTDLDQGRDC
ncbi:MAG: cbb3-type cytochrome oxidase assembly protein CcoS [Pacificibacter sp.]|jgi:cbb3-type cytochrome oxidase maturation protein